MKTKIIPAILACSAILASANMVPASTQTPASGYPDFATIYLEYIPDQFVVELKAIKLYINTFMHRNVSHEASINEIYNTLKDKLKPKWIKVVGDFNPRGNVHTVIECRSDMVVPK